MTITEHYNIYLFGLELLRLLINKNTLLVLL